MPKLTPVMFNKVGEALFGPSWRTALAAALGVGERTVRRWQQPDANIPAGVMPDLVKLCREHAAELIGYADKFDGITGNYNGGDTPPI